MEFYGDAISAVVNLGRLVKACLEYVGLRLNSKRHLAQLERELDGNHAQDQTGTSDSYRRHQSPRMRLRNPPNFSRSRETMFRSPVSQLSGLT